MEERKDAVRSGHLLRNESDAARNLVHFQDQRDRVEGASGHRASFS